MFICSHYPFGKTDMKTAIVCTYISRQAQLNNTLNSFKQYNPDDFVVIVVDDGSPVDIVLPELPFKVDVVKLRDKTWHNTCIPFNYGFHKALEYSPDVVIIQNAECLHNGDILSEAAKVTDANYLSFACYSLSQSQWIDCEIQNKAPEFNDDSAWYNHSVYRPFGFHFCNAITTTNLKKLNGFDERLWNGIAYEDNMLLHQVLKLGLKIDFIDNPFVFHQWHDRPYEITEELVRRNYTTFIELEQIPEYRAVHVLTPDL
jgi:glycosyltransferase involved in cell wall biosynthesis